MRQHLSASRQLPAPTNYLPTPTGTQTCNKCKASVQNKRPDRGVQLGSATVKAPTGAFKWLSHTLPRLELLGLDVQPIEAAMEARKLLRVM